MIVVASHAGDEHATAVLNELSTTRHRSVLIDTADYPVAADLTMRFGPGTKGSWSTRESRVPLEEVGAVWWRRPRPYALDPDLDPTAASFVYTECHEAVSGMWQTLDAAWVNPVASDEVAHHKPLQLACAQELGLQVPRTSVTNDPAEARAFVAEIGIGRTVCKTFVASEQHWRETRLVRPEEVSLLDGVRLAPVILQEFVPASTDVRVTVTGEDLWVADIVAGPDSYAIDYRMDMGAATFTPSQLPDKVAELLLLLMKRLDIVYGAIDLRRTADGQYVFLEVNPAGEWLFVEERTGLPISASMADLLRRLDTKETR